MPTGIYKRIKQFSKKHKKNLSIAAKKRFLSFPKIFWIKVKKTQTCWNWIGYIGKTGYGQFKKNNKMQKAHRVSYELYKGKIRRELEIDHLCRNKKCVNPKHLEAVTHRENMLRGNSFVAINAKKIRCKYGHKFDKKNTGFFIDKNKCQGRYCKKCRNLYQKYYRIKQKNVISSTN